MKYLAALEEICNAVSDEEIAAMLREHLVMNTRYVLAAAAGKTVCLLLESGTTNVYYKTVRDYWQTEQDLDEDELNIYMDQMGIDDYIDTFASSDWESYISVLMDILEKYSDADTETWLALLVAQQSSEAVRAERATAVAIDENGDAVLDGYQITVQSPLSLVRDVSMKIMVEGVELEDENWDGFYGDTFELGKIPGTLALEEFFTELADTEDLSYGVREVYSSPETSFILDTSVDRWFEIVDSEGVGHVISVGEVDPEHATELRIPAKIQLNDAEEEDYRTEMNGWLIYSNGSFIGFSDQESPTPLMLLSDESFDDATVFLCQTGLKSFMDWSVYVFGKIGKPFVLPAEERTNDRGMSIVMTPVSEIADLSGGSLVSQPVITDLYGYEHDLSSALVQADADFAAGKMIRSIEGAEITAGELTYTGAAQKPVFTITFQGETLEENVDFAVLVEARTEPGEYRAIVYGIGDYCDFVVTDFTIGEEIAETAEAEE